MKKKKSKKSSNKRKYFTQNNNENQSQKIVAISDEKQVEYQITIYFIKIFDL